MTKCYWILTLLMMLAPQSLFAQPPTATQKSPPAGPSPTLSVPLPPEIGVVVTVQEMPGMENPKSFWEGDYELRIADWQAVVERTKAGDKGRHGEILAQVTSPRRSLVAKDAQQLRLTVPVTAALGERLKQQNTNPQAFWLHSTVHFFDAKLQRHFAFEVNRVWEFKLFPHGQADITIKLEPDGSYSSWGPMPKVMPAGYSMVEVPAVKKNETKRP